VAEHNQLVIEHLRRPLWWVRALAALTIGTLVALVLWATFQLANLAGTGGVADTIQAIDAGTNEVIVLSLAVFFFFKLEAGSSGVPRCARCIDCEALLMWWTCTNSPKTRRRYSGRSKRPPHRPCGHFPALTLSDSLLFGVVRSDEQARSLACSTSSGSGRARRSK